MKLSVKIGAQIIFVLLVLHENKAYIFADSIQK